jgi:hypothetical protein
MNSLSQPTREIRVLYDLKATMRDGIKLSSDVSDAHVAPRTQTACITYVNQLSLPNSPSLTTSTPTSACLRTTSPTAALISPDSSPQHTCDATVAPASGAS